MSSACPACAAAPAAGEVARRVTEVHGVAFSVPSMHCAACMGKIERGLADVPGVQDARVNLTLKRVQVTGNVAEEAIRDRLDSLGFEAYPLDADVLGREADPLGRDLAMRLGVAGFAMMNVMLLSVAVWSGAGDATRDLFHLISAAIAVPVVGYSGQPFFRNAWDALRVRRLNMDVPISLAILLATGMSVYESLNGGSHAYFDAGLSLTFFLLIGRYLDHRTRASARSAARELAALEVQAAQRIDGAGRAQSVPLSALAIGDKVLVPAGDRVPVDGTLQDAAGAVTDRSFLTGESDPITAEAGTALRAGEVNLGAPFTIVATAVGEDTSLRRIARLVEQAEGARNKYTSLADRAAQVYAPLVHILAILAFVGWMAATGDARFALNVAIAVLIITCPCALGLAVPAVSTAAIGRLYGLGFLVKSGTALERLAEVDEVAFDKTGTLTLPGVQIDLAGLPETEKGVLKALAQRSSHPVSRAVAALLENVAPAEVADVAERAGAGMAGRFGTQDVWFGKSSDGLVLRIGERSLVLGQGEQLRAGAKEAVPVLKAMGLPVSLVSGDARSAVARVAKRLNIDDVGAEVTADEKHAWVTARQAAGSRVAMVGDGLNDTAVLAAAHASVAPSSALDASRNAADVVLMRDGLADLPALFSTARKATRLSRQNFAIAAAYNAVAIPVALAGFATPMLAAIAMSASSLTVLLNALRVRRVQ